MQCYLNIHIISQDEKSMQNMIVLNCPFSSLGYLASSVHDSEINPNQYSLSKR